jgi:DNA (cytosine-5)-methyltransferase 1
MRRVVEAADLFCGGGGTSSGLRQACDALGLKLKLLAINHWDVAIQTHSANHPYADHICASVEVVDPRRAVPGGKLDILIAAPECIHHSRARGGKPRSEQRRASAWQVIRWCSALYVRCVIVENVAEFESWGPLGADGKPLKSKKGEEFLAWINAFKALGYRVDHRVLCAANYGEATTRERLFVVARRGNRPIEWPEPTHTPDGAPTLFGPTEPWRPAREIIDWDLKGESVFNREKPLCENTMRRILVGLKRFSGLPFVLPNEGFYRGNAPRLVSEPLPTVTASRGAGHLVRPYLVKLRGTSTAASVEQPLPTVTTSGTHLGLCQPYVCTYHGGPRGQERVRSVEEPLPVQDTANRHALAQPYILNVRGGDDGYCRGASVEEPLPTLTATPPLALVEPVAYDGDVASLDGPLDLQDGDERYALAIPLADERGEVVLDINYRMLEPHETAAAMGFDEDYQFHGTKTDVKRQIGNAVSVRQARTLCLTQLRQMYRL